MDQSDGQSIFNAGRVGYFKKLVTVFPLDAAES